MALLFIEFSSGVNDGWLKLLSSIEEIDDIIERFHPVDIDLIDNGSFAYVLFGNDESFELFFSCAYGYRQGAAHWLQLPVQAQFAHHEIFVEMVAHHFVVCGKYCNGERKVVAASLFAQVSWRHIDCDVGHGKLESVVLHGCGNSVATFFYGIVGQSGKVV